MSSPRGADPAWRVLYRVGAVSAWVFVATLVLAIVIAIVTPAARAPEGNTTWTRRLVVTPVQS